MIYVWIFLDIFLPCTDLRFDKQNNFWKYRLLRTLKLLHLSAKENFTDPHLFYLNK